MNATFRLVAALSLGLGATCTCAAETDGKTPDPASTDAALLGDYAKPARTDWQGGKPPEANPYLYDVSEREPRQPEGRGALVANPDGC